MGRHASQAAAPLRCLPKVAERKPAEAMPLTLRHHVTGAAAFCEPDPSPNPSPNPNQAPRPSGSL